MSGLSGTWSRHAPRNYGRAGAGAHTRFCPWPLRGTSRRARLDASIGAIYGLLTAAQSHHSLISQPRSCSAPARAIAKAPRTADLLKSRQYPAEPGRGRYKRLPQKGEHDARRSASERRLRAQSRSFFHVPRRLITARRLPHIRSATYGPTTSSCKRRLTPSLEKTDLKIKSTSIHRRA